MDQLFSIHAAFGWAALILLLAVAASVPLEDQPYRDDDPRCWCEAFGTAREDCYCVSFDEGGDRR